MAENTIDVTEHSVVSDYTAIGEIVNQALKKDLKDIEINNGISTGFKLLDKEVLGFQNGQLNTISVKPGMGKTALMLSIASNIAIKKNHSIAIFSLERSKQKITNRIIESETGLSVNNLLNRDIKDSENDHLQTLLSNIAKASIFIDDTTVLSHNEICKRANELKRNEYVELIIIDYLELLVSNIADETAREKQLDIIVNSLKILAKELNIPILLFSQHNKVIDADKLTEKPTLNLLPDYIVESSDVILFLHRNDIYCKPNGKSSKGNVVEVIIAKNRNITDISVVPLRYIDSIAKFTD